MNLSSIVSSILGVLVLLAVFTVPGLEFHNTGKGLCVLFGVSNVGLSLLATKLSPKFNWYPDPMFSLMAQIGLSFLVLAVGL